jgi:hypothetical protein
VSFQKVLKTQKRMEKRMAKLAKRQQRNKQNDEAPASADATPTDELIEVEKGEHSVKTEI